MIGVLTTGGDGSLSEFVSPFVTMGGEVYYLMNDSYGDITLCRTDGTAAGTQVVKEIAHADVGATFPDYGQRLNVLTVVDNKLYFSGGDAVNGEELWTSDGTSAGTMQVKDIDTFAIQGMRTGHDEVQSAPAIFGGKTYFMGADRPMATSCGRSAAAPPRCSPI
ncbi:MAG: hypothetical protein WDM81_16275 [Rhizomicrobium sp.]